MKMIKTDKLVFEYAKRDEEGNIIGKSRAIDEVWISSRDSLLRSWGIMALGSLHLQSI
jgi:hypothetical protein